MALISPTRSSSILECGVSPFEVFWKLDGTDKNVVRAGEQTMSERVKEALQDFNAAGQAS